MFARSFWYVVLAALLVAVPLTAARSSSAAPAPVRIMALGDSITAGPGCWRAKLWHRLQTGGHTGLDFVGGVSDGGGCNPGYAYDWDHEGHGGYAATGIADNNQLPPWLAAARPDIVLMHLGTNDMWGGYIPTATKLAAFTKLVGQMRAQNPAVRVVVAQIVPMSQAACATCPADVVALNTAIPGWAAGLSTAQSPIVVADLWTGFDAVTDTGDGVHPNDAGFQKMADGWYPALTRLLDGGTPPSPSPSSPSPSASSSPSASRSPSSSASPSASASRSPSVSASPSGSPSGGARCTASYRVISQWGGSFQGEVTVRNDSAAVVPAWTVSFAFTGGQQVTQSWNTALTQTGTRVLARNVTYNGTLAPGGSTSFGFLANWDSTTNPTPAPTCTPA